MDAFTFRRGRLFCEDVNLENLAERYDTPVYVYSRATALGHLEGIQAAFAELDPSLHFAVKSCSNIHLLRELAAAGAGADVVSGGELHRSRLAGIPAELTSFAGVGKSDAELEQAVKSGIGYINVESEDELGALATAASRIGRSVRAAIRVNPDVASYRTHRKTTTGLRGNKFGVDIDHVEDLFGQAHALSNVVLDGLHVHLGSPIHTAEPYRLALTRLAELADKLEAGGHPVRTINMGGGFAAAYETGGAPGWNHYADTIVPILRPFVQRGGRVIMEPGRSVMANAGVLLTRIRRIKDAGDRRVAVVDAGMNDLLRVALYDASHFIWPVHPAEGHLPPRWSSSNGATHLTRYDVAGPLCESSDYFVQDRLLPPLDAGQLLCVYTAGAYGMAMANQYNTIPRCPEVLVDGTDAVLIRRRETYADLMAPELDARALPEA